MMILVELVAPVTSAFNSRAQMRALLDDLGWQIKLNEEQHEAFRAASGLIDAIEELTELIDALRTQGISEEAIEPMLDAAIAIYEGVRALSEVDASQIGALPAPFNDPGSWGQLAIRLPEYLVVSYLETALPTLYEALALLRIVTQEPWPDQIDADPQALTGSTRRRVDWQALGELLAAPDQYLKDLIGWPDAIDADRIQHELLRIAAIMGFEPDVAPMRTELIEAWLPGNPIQNPLELYVPIFDRWIAGGAGHTALGLVLGPASRANGSLAGFAMTSVAEGAIESELALSTDWTLNVAASGELDRTVEAKILTSGPELAIAPEGGLAIDLEIVFKPDTPKRLFGGDTGARMEISGFKAGVAFNAQGEPEIAVKAGTVPGQDGNMGLKLVISPGEGDGFIAEILGDNSMSVDAALAMRWSNVSGFALEGGVGFDVVIPVDIKLGPIFLTQVRVGLEAGADGLTVEGAITGGLDIAVLAVSVDDIGLRAQVVPVEEGERGMLGPIDLKLGFKPPTGLGMVIDAAGVVTGGGYLYHDEDLAEYGGVAEIGFLSLKLSAIGILTTRMPDGEEGWSLFLAVFSEFPPIQLSFGFTLNGVGGLVGLHRTFDDEALRERLLAGALDSIMFPQDPVANAPQIISDIRAVFPPSQGQFVFGAMLKFGWGTPSIVSLELGVIVELPDPIKIALLGQLGMILPKPDATLIEINMDMFGVANLTEGTIALDAVIRDSHIMHLITLSGAMAFRANFGDKPSMLLSIGGFHPDFTPPPGVPKLGRMKAALPLGKYAAVELSGYVAVTSNSFQTGGSVDIWVKVSGLSAEGWFKFDALIQFSPFGFTFTVEIGFTVSFRSKTLMGVDVFLAVNGPAPWTLDGYAQVKILGFKKKLIVDLELGNKKHIEVPRYNVLDLLETALKERDRWLIGAATEAPSVAYAKRADGSVIFDPRGSISFVQTVVPLGLQIEKFGNGTVEGPTRFDIEWVEIGGDQSAFDTVDEWFARGEFIKMDEDERISSPSFVEYAGGARIEAPGEELGAGFEGVEGYEEVIVDAESNRRETSKRDAVNETQRIKPDKAEQSSAMKAQGEARAGGIPTMRVRKLSISDGPRNRSLKSSGSRLRQTGKYRALKQNSPERKRNEEVAMVQNAQTFVPEIGRRSFS